MKYILCYGDSNTWGYHDQTGERYEYVERWPGVLKMLLGDQYHLYENGLKGRTTIFEDPIDAGRCGKTGFKTILEVHAPLDLVIIMLGTNDAKSKFSLQAWDIAWGVDWLTKCVKQSKCGRNLAEPKILIVSPPPLKNKWEGYVLGSDFNDTSVAVVQKLSLAYQKIAELNEVYFLDAKQYTEIGEDGVHLSAAQQQQLGQAIYEKIKTMDV